MDRVVVFTDRHGEDWEWIPPVSGKGLENYARRRVDGHQLPFGEFMGRYANEAHLRNAWVRARYDYPPDGDIMHSMCTIDAPCGDDCFKPGHDH
jgi:hypothetical protein